MRSTVQGFRLWWSQIFALTRKELLQFSRDWILLLAVVYFFTGEVYVAGAGMTMDLNHAPIAVMDHDRSAASREWLALLRAPYYEMKGSIQTQQEALQLLDQGKLLGVIDIPAHFQENLLKQQPTDIFFQLDASNVMLGNLASSYSGLANAQFNQNWQLNLQNRIAEQTQKMPVVELNYSVLYNPALQDTWFMPISEMMTVLTLLGLFLSAAVTVKEKERGTIEQLSITPLTPFQILFPKIIAVELILLSGVTLSLFGVIIPAFNVPFQGSVALFFAAAALYIYAISGLGLLIATLSKNLSQVMMVSFLTMMPILLLSGAWTPAEAMPAFEQALVGFSPLYYFIEMGYGIILKGAGFSDLWQSFGLLFLLGTALFLLGIYAFKRQFQQSS
ncbi:ABC transporter permease [Thiosulfativibrio zosterae]|uniref:ABC transporter n=1 Tax=Thiosulfativibrio zosterae TaxID=2675053 RepID=A0A6F8PKA5_9GAMM|nr:ABC transporter permease [Thiosulfativibrio zosterae]BBP42487.1 ABC transporter [Thiosulfativibrio zosterae]